MISSFITILFLIRGFAKTSYERIIFSNGLENKLILLENSIVSGTFCTTKRLFLILVFLFVLFFCFASTDLGNSDPGSTNIVNSSIRIALPAMRDQESLLLPVDSKIGIISKTFSSAQHIFLGYALSNEYSYEWMEEFVEASSRSVVSALFGSWLEEHLPLEGFLTSVLLENGDGSVSINVRKGDDAACFVIEKVEDRFYIVAIKEL